MLSKISLSVSLILLSSQSFAGDNLTSQSFSNNINMETRYTHLQELKKDDPLNFEACIPSKYDKSITCDYKYKIMQDKNFKYTLVILKREEGEGGKGSASGKNFYPLLDHPLPDSLLEENKDQATVLTDCYWLPDYDAPSYMSLIALGNVQDGMVSKLIVALEFDESVEYILEPKVDLIDCVY